MQKVKTTFLLLGLFFVTGCANSMVRSWPSEVGVIDSRSKVKALIDQSQIEHCVKVVAGWDTTEAKDDYSRFKISHIIDDPIMIRQIVSVMKRAKFVYHPMFTVTPPLHVVFIDAKSRPLAAILVNDGYYRPLSVRRTFFGWETNDVLQNEAKYLGAWIGEWESTMRGR
jgi:hypothetical protein